MPNLTWSLKQEFLLIMLYPYTPDTRDLAEFLGVSYHAMKSKATVLKLLRMVPNSRMSTETPAEVKFIKKNYLTMPLKRMADHLGRHDIFIRSVLKRLELTIPREIIEQRIQDARIKPGNIPKNKGKKQKDYMSKEQIEKTKATRFKKGNLPYNSIGVKDGDIHIRHDHKDRGGPPYKYIRISLGKWYPLHQHKWEKKNGKLPEGHCLWFIDGNTMNCTLKNLELITRAENMKRNSASRRLTDGYVAATMSRQKGGVGKYNKDMQRRLLKRPDLIDLKRQTLILKRTIHEQGKR